MAWVAQATGINKDIVSKYVKALVQDGWLIPAAMHGRAQGYYLGKGVLTVRTLEKAKRKSNLLMEPSLSPDGVGGNLLMELVETRPSCGGDDGGGGDVWSRQRQARRTRGPRAQQRIAFSWPECSMMRFVETRMEPP